MLMYKSLNIMNKVKKILCILSLTILCLLTLPTQFALAHRPHDVIEDIVLSSNYDRDRTLLILVRSNVFKSQDGGQTWRRIVKGLNNRLGSDLISLSISRKNPKILFASSLYDGIYKSEDEGNSWQQVNQGLDTLEINFVVVSPYNEKIILATGAKKGLYKTEDYGKNWSSILKGEQKIQAVNFFPDDTNKIIIGDERGNLYLSEDAGTNWKNLPKLQDSIAKIAISPQYDRDKTILIGTKKGKIYQTTNTNFTFSESSSGISGGSIEDLVFSPDYNRDRLIFASTQDNGFFESADLGKTWKNKSQGLTKDEQADEPQFKKPHFTKLIVSPTFSRDKTIFLGGFNGLFLTNNLGNSWQEINTLSTGTITGLAVGPNDTIGVATYVGEAYLSKDKGNTWEAINKGLAIPRFSKNFRKPNQDPRRFFDIALSPNFTNDRSLFISLLWDSILSSDNEGNNWEIVPLSKTSRGQIIVVSPNFAEDRTLFAEGQQGIIFRSTDGGKSYQDVANLKKRPNNEPPSLVISPNFAVDKTLYATGIEGVYQSKDGGENWQSINKGLDIAPSSTIKLAISPNYEGDRTLFAGTEVGMFKTQDGGQNWIKLKNFLSKEKFPLVEAIAISPNYAKDREAIVSVRGKGLLKTTDSGESFQAIGDASVPFARMGNLPSASVPLKYSPNYEGDRTLYGFGSANTEVFQSTDGGNTWKAIAIPRTKEDTSFNLLNSYLLAKVFFDVYPIWRFVAALVASALVYLILTLLKLEKRFDFYKSYFKLGLTFIAFIIVFVGLL
jgi:photosystem II stability/assembly factor-like uncharacterized protein